MFGGEYAYFIDQLLLPLCFSADFTKFLILQNNEKNLSISLLFCAYYKLSKR